MKHYILATALALGLMGGMTTSCDDQLDVEQHGAVNTDTFYSNDAECLEGLAALYSIFNTMQSDYSSWYTNEWFFALAMSDDCYTGGGDRGNDGTFEEINELRHTAANGKIAQLFKIYYNTIYRCNILTSRVPGDTPTQQRIIAEAKTIRAFCYLRLAGYFGDVPYIDHAITDGNYAQPLTARAQIFESIANDLKEAIASGVMLEKTSPESPVVNVTKQTAQALLGKVYVYWSTFEKVNKWAEAREVLDAVINSGKYRLVEKAKDGYDFNDQFHITGRFSPESMFEVNRQYDANNLPMMASVQRLGWRTERFVPSELEAAKASGAVNCSSSSYGFFNPTQDLYDAFVEMEGVDGYRLNQTIRTYKDLTTIPLRIATGKYLYATSGLLMNKCCPREEETVKVHYVAQDYVMLRYADVLLLAAEAQLPANGGNQAKCDQYLNLIKARAGEPASKMQGNYTLTDVQVERRLELAFEGSRFFDVVRWGIIADAYKDKGKQIPNLYGLADGSDNDNEQKENVNGYNVSYLTTASQGYQPKFSVLPLPQSELDVNQLVEQNALWK